MSRVNFSYASALGTNQGVQLLGGHGGIFRFTFDDLTCFYFTRQQFLKLENSPASSKNQFLAKMASGYDDC